MTPGLVPFVDLDRVHAPLREELERALIDLARRGDFILGADVARFEAEFAEFVGTDNAIGVNSGTAALAIALGAAGIGPGDEVILPAHTYIASALAVVHAGAVPVFCDVDSRSGLIDLESAAAVVGERTAAVLCVHLYGQACDMDEMVTFAERHGLALFEDAAQAHGASWRAAPAGSFGLASAFSFYPSKNLGAFGDGGIICTNDSRLAEGARRMRNLGQLEKGDHAVAGFNERLDTMHAAVLRVKLPHLDAWNRARREAATVYRDHLPAEVTALPVRDAATDANHLFPIRVARRDETARALVERGIGVGVHYSPTVPRQPPFLGSEARVSFECADLWAREELSLPMFAGLTADEVKLVCETLADVVAEAKNAEERSVA